MSKRRLFWAVSPNIWSLKTDEKTKKDVISSKVRSWETQSIHLTVLKPTENQRPWLLFPDQLVIGHPRNRKIKKVTILPAADKQIKSILA